MFCNSKGNRSLKKSRQNSFQQSSQALKRHYTLRTSITSNEIPLEGLWNVLVFLNFFLNPLPWLFIIAAFFFFFLIKTSWRNCKENSQDMLFWTQAFQTILYLPAWKRLSGRERSDYWLLLRDAFFCLLRCSWETRLNEKEINGQPCKQVLLSLTLQSRQGWQWKCWLNMQIPSLGQWLEGRLICLLMQLATHHFPSHGLSHFNSSFSKSKDENVA